VSVDPLGIRSAWIEHTSGRGASGHARVSLRERVSGFATRGHRQLALAAVTGLLTGAAVAAFDWVVAQHLLDRLYDLPVPVQVGAPLVGLALAAASLRWLAGRASPSTSDEYIRSFHEPGRRLDLRPVMGRVVASAATLGFGGAMGFEGPSMYMGAAIGTAVQARFRRWFDAVDLKVLMVAGAAAGVAAIFKTPATGAIFAIEVPYQDDTAKRMLFPALIAAACGYLVFVAINGTQPLFPINGTPPFGFRELAGAAVLGLLAGVGARVFARFVAWAKTWQSRANPVVSVVAGGTTLALLVVVSRVVYGDTLTIGAGYRVIGWVVAGHHALWAVALLLVLRAIVTPATVAGGGAGGLFVPLVVLGALLGDACGVAVHEPTTSLFPVIGVAAFLGAGYRTPIAAVVFVAESTGRPGFIVPGLVAAVVAQLFMGERSVSVYQHARRTGHLERRFALPVGPAIQTDVATAPADLTIDEAMSQHLLVTRHTTVPVLDGHRLVGIVRLEDLSAVPRDEWTTATLLEALPEQQPTAAPSWTIEQAVRAMDASDRDVLGVSDDDGRFVGIVTLADLMRLDEILGTTEDPSA
jgi:CIC family chloride channel protein